MAVSIELAGVTRRYGDKAAVSDLCLTIGRGEFVALVGPSGCGKTTTLRLIAGLEMPDNGTIHFDGRDMAAVRPADRNIGFVFQNFALYPGTSVLENLTLPLRARGESAVEARRRACEMSERLGIDGLIHRHVDTLSGGEQQRVALGRALIRNPPLLLLDEPLASLDVGLRASLRELLAEVHAERGMTIVYVTHDPLEMAALAHRIAVIEQGTLVQSGSLSDLSTDPRSVFVAQHMTTLPLNVGTGTLSKVDQGWRLDTDFGSHHLRKNLNGVEPGAPVIWVLDPGAVHVHSGGDMVVSRVLETLGVRLAHVRGRTALWCAAADSLEAGAKVSVDFDAGSVWLFTPSGERIRES